MEKQPSPFTIRGHHTEIGPFGLDECLYLNGNPTLEEMSQHSNQFIADTLHCSRGHAVVYSYDTVGITTHDEAVFHARDIATMTEFGNLAESELIVLNTLPDRLCNSCIFGNHCLDKETALIDHESIASLIDFAQWLGYREGIDFTLGVDANGFNQVIISKKTYLNIIAAEVFYNSKV